MPRLMPSVGKAIPLAHRDLRDYPPVVSEDRRPCRAVEDPDQALSAVSLALRNDID
jgi:hypothetical protein